MTYLGVYSQFKSVSTYLRHMYHGTKFEINFPIAYQHLKPLALQNAFFERKKKSCSSFFILFFYIIFKIKRKTWQSASFFMGRT